MADEILKRDQNTITVLGGVTDNAAQDIKMLRVDPTTKRLLVSASGGGLSLETDGTPNGDQSLLNLAAGTNITLTDNGTGTVTIDAGGGSTDISCRVYQTGTSALTGSWVTCAFAAEDFDTDTMHDNSTNNSRITFTTAGKYCVGGVINIDGANGTDNIGTRVRLNGSTVIVQSKVGASGALSAPQGVSVSTIYNFSASDYVELQGNAPTLNSSGDAQTNFWAYKIA